MGNYDTAGGHSRSGGNIYEKMGWDSLEKGGSNKIKYMSKNTLHKTLGSVLEVWPTDLLIQVLVGLPYAVPEKVQVEYLRSTLGQPIFGCWIHTMVVGIPCSYRYKNQNYQVGNSSYSMDVPNTHIHHVQVRWCCYCTQQLT